MVRFAVLAAALAAVAAMALPPGALAEVQVLSAEGDELASFAAAKCQRASTKRALLKFTATARPDGWRLSIDLFTSGRVHKLPYGGPNQVTVEGPDGQWTSLNVPPNAPPGGGSIEFNQSRSRLGIGFSPIFNGDASSTVGVAAVSPAGTRRRSGPAGVRRT